MGDDDELKRKAVAAVLDSGMTQAAVCRHFGITPYRLQIWLAEERARRAQLEDIQRKRAAESAEHQLRRTVADWEQNSVYSDQISEGLKRAHAVHIIFDYVVGGPLLLVAGIAGSFFLLVGMVVVVDVLTTATNGWIAAFLCFLVVLVILILIVWVWSAAQYFKGLIFRSLAPFAYAVHNLRQALLILERHDDALFSPPLTEADKAAIRKVTKGIGKAAHILDATLRQGREHGSRISGGNERQARRRVAAYVAKTEELLWEKGRPGRQQAIDILKVAAYETVLRKWALHEFSDIAAPEAISLWQRRISPFLRGAITFGGTFGPIAWQVFGAADQSPGHFIRAYLQSRGLLG